MNTAIVATGHRSNPFDLEGGFTVHFSTDDFSPEGPPRGATSRGFTLTVRALRKTVPTIEYLLERASDGVRFEGRIECRSAVRQHFAATGRFIHPNQSAPTGKIDISLHWDGSRGVFSATWVVKRPASPAIRASEPGRPARVIALSSAAAAQSGVQLAHGIAGNGDHLSNDITR